jgi:hypothetical protein
MKRTTKPEVKVGDLIGFTGVGWECHAINILTYGIPNYHIAHLGIIGEYSNELLMFESTTLSNLQCVIQGKMFDGVQAVHLEDRCEGYPGKIWHYPLHRTLYKHEATRLNQFLTSRIGTRYDTRGALRAGGKLWSWWKSLLHEEDISSLFCSELVAATHTHVGLIRTGSVSRWNPNRLLRYERAQNILTKPWRLV